MEKRWQDAWDKAVIDGSYLEVLRDKMTEQERRRLYMGEFPVHIGVDPASDDGDMSVEFVSESVLRHRP